MLTLHHYPLCPSSRAIRLALVQSAIEFVQSDVKPWAPDREFLNLNPAGTLPVLTVENKVISGAYPIVEYLAETATARDGLGASRTSLWPGTPGERAEARRVSEWFLRKFDIEVSQYLLEEKIYKPMSGVRSPPDLGAIRASRANLRYHLSYVSFLSEQRKWLGGDHMSFGDFAAAAQLSVMDYLSEISWSEFPEAKAWYARMKSRPAFRPLLADRLPGFNPPEAYANLDF
jgi:glutathione S-transferase